MFALLLDDAELVRQVMVQTLRGIPCCEPMSFAEPEAALTWAHAHADETGIVLSDYDMPGMNGVEFIRAARTIPGMELVPIVMITALDQRAVRRAALEAGATDFLAKPFDPVELRTRVTNLLALHNARRELENRAAMLSQEVAAAVKVIETREREIVTLLMNAAEDRDNDTGHHVARVAKYVGIIASGLGFDPARCRELSFASTMHDVGKIGVPDAILLKSGPLTDEERKEMEKHAPRGQRLLQQSTSAVLKVAAEIAGSHHERWDGTGYPLGLKGEAIPVAGRITAVADVFDALTNERPYKNAWSPEDARHYLITNAGRHFDPHCVEALVSKWPEVVAVAFGQEALAA
jgi:putative two-component system response regulator